LAEKTGKYRDDAGYLRFKASEANFAADPTAANEPAYEQALTAFLKEFPKHKASPEARYRLGELRQRQEKYAEAEAEYAQVKGDPAFDVRAAFATAQVIVKRLEQAPEDSKPDPALMARARTALDAFWTQLKGHDPKALGDIPLADMNGQAALMGAYLAALSEKPDYERALTLLDGFEEKYPKLAGQRAQVVKLRLLAVARLGKLDAAAVEAARPEVASLEPTYLDDLATRLLTRAAREQATGNAAAAAAGKRAALLLSEKALQTPGAASLTPAVRRRLQSTAASLREEAGELAPALALYQAVLKESPDVVSARAGAARVLEAEGKVGEARALWDAVLGAGPGKPGFLESHYQSARLSVALGDTARACEVVRQVPAEMLVNANADTPKKISEILRTCPS
jgi:tetratricopeptide (TPR) repeat protein